MKPKANRSSMTFDDLSLLAMESLDGIDDKQLVKMLRVVIPGIKIRWSYNDDCYWVTMPD